MENDTAQVEKEKRGTNGNHSVSRWSPTKEQICILENMYMEGIRTPNAEQIQQITSRLRAYGNIEGKNVFYWFQNHKARQRQKLKQKQQCIAYSNPFLHASHPISQTVVCAPCWLQHSGISFYAQQPKVVATGSICSMSGNVMPLGMQQNVVDYNSSTSNPEVLTLFPLHPTGILEEKTINQVPSHHADTFSAKSLGVDEDHHFRNQPFIDFFTSEQRSRGKDCVIQQNN